MGHGGKRRGALAVTAATVALGLLVGCAGLPDDDAWTPPAWPDDDAVVPVLTGPESRSGSQADPTEHSASDPVGDPVVNTAVAEVDTAGLIDGRIRNDSAGLQARYVEVLGADGFNARVSEILENAKAGTGVPEWEPEVFDATAGLADRGCATGSTTRPAAELMADPAFGPTGGAGTAVTCEIVSAFGPVLGVAFRTVTGTVDAIASDHTEVLFADFEANTGIEATTIWTPAAAAELWEGAVQSLRREAGSLSAAVLQPPSAQQLAIAEAALGSARVDDASIQFTFPAGLTSAELEALDIPATAATLAVTITGTAEALAPEGWLTPEGEQLLSHHGTPFRGVPAWNAAHAVDCDLVACVAVTYDDGPSGFTAELLDILAAHEAPATFFMLGGAVAGAGDVVARAAASGHELASHSMTHPDLTSVSTKAARAEVLDAGKLITEITGQPVTMYRPPYGALNEEVIDAVKLPAILWSIDTLDWQRPGEAELIDRAAVAASPGDIILFHDTHADTVNAAGEVLEVLKDRGLTPVTVTQLFEGAVPSGRVSGR